MAAPPARFDTLPLELLFVILDLCQDETVLNVAKTCRRLNNISIPIFFRRLDVSDSPHDSTLIRPLHDSRSDQLSGLTADLSLTSIKRFVCILNHRHDNPREQEDFRRLSPIEGLKKNIRRVNALISKLESVGSICLVFYPMGGFWSLRALVVEEFLSAFFELVETATLRGCTSLQILHPHPIALKAPYRFQITIPSVIENMVVKGLSLVRTRDSELDGDGWKYSQVYKYNSPPSLSSAVMKNNKLKTLELYSDFLLIPPFSLWTFAFMKCSQITHLSLSLHSLITKGEFHNYIFPNIIDALPDLEEFRLAASRDDILVSAVELMPQLSKLRKVTFGSNQYGQFPPPSYGLSPLRLPNLAIFTGYIEQAVYLLGNVTCPALSTVNLIIDDTRGRPNYTVIGKKLSALKNRFREMGITPSTNMCVSNHGNGKHTPLPISSIFEDSAWDVDFSMVSQLTLELPISIGGDDASHIEYIMGWLDIFSGLDAVTLTTRQPLSESTLLADMITSEYTNIKSFNIVDYPAVFHYHWSSAPNDIRRGMDRRSDIATFRNKSIEGCVCSEF